MPETAAQPRALRLAGAIGYLEALAPIVYGFSIAAFERRGTTTGISGSGADLAPTVLIAVYVGFAGLVFLVTRLLMQGRRAALTAYLLVQAFGLVVAQPLLQGGGTRIVGVLLIVLSVTAAVSVLMKSARGALR